MTVQLFLGLPGTGKTQLMVDYVGSQDLSEQAFFVVDRAGEWADPRRWRGKVPRALTIINNDNISRIDKDGSAAPGIWVFQSPWEGFEVASLVTGLGNAVYVDDEIDLEATYKNWSESPLREIVHRGRHLPNHNGEICQCSILGAARRPQNLHTDLTSMADEVSLFRLAGSRTLKRIVEESYVTEEECEELKAVPNFHFRVWRSTEGKSGEMQKIKPPKF